MLVDIPNIGSVEFPDGMHPDDVSSIIRTKLIPQYQLSQKIASIGPISAPAAQGLVNPVSDVPRQIPHWSDLTQSVLNTQGMQPGIGKALAEQASPLNVGLGIAAPAMTLSKALLYPAAAYFGYQGLGKMLPESLGNIAGNPNMSPGEKHYNEANAVMGAAPLVLPLAKLGTEMVGDLVQSGYNGNGIPNRFASIRLKNAKVGLGNNAGSIFPSSGSGVPSTPNPIAGSSDQTATPSIPTGFKATLAAVPDKDLQTRYTAAVDAGRQLIAAGKYQEAANMATMGQFMREELQNRKTLNTQQTIQGVQNDNQGRLQSAAGEQTQSSPQENRENVQGQTGGIVEGQVQKAPEVQVSGNVSGLGRPASSGDVQGLRGEDSVNRVSITQKVKAGVPLNHADLAYLYQMPFESSKELMQQVNRNAMTLLPESVPNRLAIQNAQRAWDVRQNVKATKQEAGQSLPQETVEQRNARLLAESQKVQDAVKLKQMQANAPLVSSAQKMVADLGKKRLSELFDHFNIPLPKGIRSFTKLNEYDIKDLYDAMQKAPENTPMDNAVKRTALSRLQKLYSAEGRVPLSKRTSEAGFFRLFGGADLSSLGLKGDTKVQGDQMYNRIKNKLGEGSAAFDYMDKAGLKVFLATLHSVKEVEDWLGSVAPKVGLHSYGMEGKVSEAKKEYDKMTHEWYDNLSPAQKAEVVMLRGSNRPETTKTIYLESANHDKAVTYINLEHQMHAQGGAETGPRASSAYSHVRSPH